MGLGPAGDVTLSAARDAAQGARALLRDGIDPIESRKEARTIAKVEASKGITFKVYAEQFISGRESGWKNEKHRQQWRNSLRDYAYPHIGNMPVADVDTVAVLKVLRPIWQSKPETASRIRGRLETILSAAKVEELRTGDNPALWRGHIAEVLPSKKSVRLVKHHAALPYAEMPAFMASLRNDGTDAALLLQFIVLTAARYSEASKAEWDEVIGPLWTVPLARMKTRRHTTRAHNVPLSDAALVVLATARKGFADHTEMIFPGGGRGPISDVNLANTIKRHTALPATTHGFRSTFRDWCGDCTDFPREVAEACLSHAVGNETEKAYRRSDALEKRRALMDAWAVFCVGQ